MIHILCNHICISVVCQRLICNCINVNYDYIIYHIRISLRGLFFLFYGHNEEYGISSADFHAEFGEQKRFAVLAFTNHRVARSMVNAPPPGLLVNLRHGWTICGTAKMSKNAGLDRSL